MAHDNAFAVPNTGAVWFGLVITAPRRNLMLRYRASHSWLMRTRHGMSSTHKRDFAREWTAKERALYRKWRSEFMRPMNATKTKRRK